MNSVKLLGLNISSDLKWNVHVSELVRKVSSYKSATSVLHHMHSLYSGVRTQPSFSSHSTKLSKRRPRKTAKTCMKIIYPELSYVEALELSGLLTLYDRREAIAAKLFDEIRADQ